MKEAQGEVRYTPEEIVRIFDAVRAQGFKDFDKSILDVLAEKVVPYEPIVVKRAAFTPRPLICNAVVFSKSQMDPCSEMVYGECAYRFGRKNGAG